MNNNISEIILQEYGLLDHKDWNNTQSLAHNDIVYVGWVSRYEYLRGFGIVIDFLDNEEHFFHVSELGEDLYTCNNDDIKSLTINHLLDDLRFSFYKTKKFKNLKSELIRKNKSEIETEVTTRFGKYKMVIDNGPIYPLIKEYDLQGFPFVYYAQIICFRLKDGKAIEIHTPKYYTSELLNNKNVYSHTLWNLLFRFIPDVLYSVEYKGVENIEDEVTVFRQESAKIVEYVKNFDIEPYKNLDNYKLSLQFDYHPTVKDSDPNQLNLVIIRNVELNDQYIGFPKICVPLTPNFEYYGSAPHHYYMMMIYGEYKDKYESYYKECKESKDNVDRSTLLEKYFYEVKKDKISYYISSYSKINHLKELLSNLKYKFIKSIIEKSNFSIKHFHPDFYDSTNDYLFKFDRDLTYYGSKVQIIHNKNLYQLYTYDHTYEGRYKGKHYIGKGYFKDKDTYYWWSNHERSLNNELKSYIDSLFNQVIEQISNEFNENI